jgi:hypothetical protein
MVGHPHGNELGLINPFSNKSCNCVLSSASSLGGIRYDLLEIGCNTSSNPWTGGTYSWQLSRIIYCPHRPTQFFCAHFVLTHVHPRKLSGRSLILNCFKPSTLNLEVLSRQASEKEDAPFDMITLLILLSLGAGYPIPGARISHRSRTRLQFSHKLHIPFRR